MIFNFKGGFQVDKNQDLLHKILPLYPNPCTLEVLFLAGQKDPVKNKFSTPSSLYVFKKSSKISLALCDVAQYRTT